MSRSGCGDGQPLKAHKGDRVRELIEEQGCELLYLPPYSPDLNPIEEAFAKIKGVLRKQLSWMSRGKVLRRSPGSTVFEDGVEDREQLAHAGHQCHLLRFAGRQKTLVEFLHYRVAACGDQGAHIQRPSDFGPPSPHATTAAQGARVAV